MKFRLCSLAALIVLSLVSNSLAQGDLTPPGAPAPTMKTLGQIEPRIPITNLPFTISSPGSYYLTASLTGFASADGVIFNSDNATLDLNGFTLIGVPGSWSAVAVSGTRSGICVRNGSVREWGNSGIHMFNAVNGLILDVRASTNGANGIWAGKGCRVNNCTAFGNRTGGINVKDGSSVEGCVASGNGYGIGAENGSMIRGCSASENLADGISVWGKAVISECQVFKNGTNGIVGGHGSIIAKCAVSENSGDGIRVIRNCQVRDNDCLENGRAAGDGAGIHATESGNRIEGNHSASADRGLDIDGTNNYVADNTVLGNTDNYDIALGNQLNLLLCEVPENLDWPCSAKFAGTLRCSSTATNGIAINSDNVTIDLDGHALIGPGTGSFDGIKEYGAFIGVHILNGSVLNWKGEGRYGVILSGYPACVESLNVSSNYHGMQMSGGVVTRCTAENNIMNGIEAYRTGITDSSAFGNGGNGFYTWSGADISHCDAVDNHNGFSATYTKIADCTATLNTSNGILASSGCDIRDNQCHQNSGGAGIEAREGSAHNRIDSNHLTGNGYGIRVLSAGNLITRNAVSGNSVANYSIAGGNDVGPIGSAATNMSPWANAEF